MTPISTVPHLYDGSLKSSIRRFFVDEFYARNVTRLTRGDHVLDLGGHKHSKRGRFDINKYDVHVVYANLLTVNGVDVQADAVKLPFIPDYFDAVICSEVLEHVQDPRTVLNQIRRVLCQGGVLLLTVPFLHRIHADPYDYGRYTDYFWESTLRDLGFGNILIEKQGLFFSVLANFFHQYIRQMHIRGPIHRIRRWLLVNILLNPFQTWALQRENCVQMKIDPFLSSFTTGFGIVAIKK